MMINILIVEDEKVVAIMLEKYVNKYFENNNVEKFNIDIASNGIEAISNIKDKKYNLVFLDVIMPKCDGFDVLDNVRIANKKQYQPYICMTTAMGEDEDIVLFKKHGATSYAIKPYGRDTIYMMLDKYIKQLFELNDIKQEEEIDEFEDFDEFTDFYDMDEEFDDSFDIEEGAMEEQNNSHKKVTAIDFLKDFDNIEYILEDVDEIDEILLELISDLDIDNIKESIETINLVLGKYSSFLNGLSDFNELSSSLHLLNNSISNIDFDNIVEKKAKYIIEFIRAILSDLSQWKEHVFILKDTVDVFYVNASVYNSCIQIEDLIKE